MNVHITLLLILLLLNLIPDKIIDRKKIILPFSFLLVLVYWAIRYDYGLDYWNYYNLFYSEKTAFSKGTTEFLFFRFLNLFDYYYQFIIVHSLVVVISLFYLVRKHIPSNYYWLFFFFLMAVPGFHFNLISAMRSTMAACVLYWAYEFCYISKKRWLLYFALVIVASLFHTSALAFLILPLIHLTIYKTRGWIIFSILIFFDILQVFYGNAIFNWVISFSDVTSGYDSYSEIVKGSNVNGLVFRSIVLFPAFYMCRCFDKIKSDYEVRDLFILAFFYLLISMVGLNFQGRFTAYLFPYFIAALLFTCLQIGKKDRIIVLVPYIIYILYGLNVYYNSLILNLYGIWSEGNMYFYHTIFDAPSFP